MKFSRKSLLNAGLSEASFWHPEFFDLATHYEREWTFWLGFCLGGNTIHIHDFCIPLDFSGIMDLQKNKKRPKKISKATDKARATLFEILQFFCLMLTVLT